MSVSGVGEDCGAPSPGMERCPPEPGRGENGGCPQLDGLRHPTQPPSQIGREPTRWDLAQENHCTYSAIIALPFWMC